MSVRAQTLSLFSLRAVHLCPLPGIKPTSSQVKHSRRCNPVRDIAMYTSLALQLLYLGLNKLSGSIPVGWKLPAGLRVSVYRAELHVSFA